MRALHQPCALLSEPCTTVRIRGMISLFTLCHTCHFLRTHVSRECSTAVRDGCTHAAAYTLHIDRHACIYVGARRGPRQGGNPWGGIVPTSRSTMPSAKPC